MTVATVCSGCGKPTTSAIDGRCPSCAAGAEVKRKRRERERTADRATGEPWRRLYGLAVWKNCRALVLERDGHRCQLRLSGRCTGDSRLHACHYPRSTAELWDIAMGDWDFFVELATDEHLVITGCEPCHLALDARGDAS